MVLIICTKSTKQSARAQILPKNVSPKPSSKDQHVSFESYINVNPLLIYSNLVFKEMTVSDVPVVHAEETYHVK